jgi:hypothetical protein
MEASSFYRCDIHAGTRERAAVVPRHCGAPSTSGLAGPIVPLLLENEAFPVSDKMGTCLVTQARVRTCRAGLLDDHEVVRLPGLVTPSPNANVLSGRRPHSGEQKRSWKTPMMITITMGIAEARRGKCRTRCDEWRTGTFRMQTHG